MRSTTRSEVENSSTTVPFREGEVLNDRWEVRSVLGRGAFGYVYLVRDTKAPVEREFALKIFRPYDEYALREIGVIAKLDHPHVVKFRWCDEVDGRWWIWTDYIPGQTLDRYELLSPAVVKEIGRQLLSTLAYLHPDSAAVARIRNSDVNTMEELWALQDAAHGIVHRDLKPQNIIFDPERVHITLIDFNVAVPAGQQGFTETMTPRYAPPDLRGIDGWSPAFDLFAVGVILWELLCLEHPYVLDIPADGGLREPSPELNSSLKSFLKKACASRQEHRFHSASDMLSDWERVWSDSTPVELWEQVVGSLRRAYERAGGHNPEASVETMTNALMNGRLLRTETAGELKSFEFCFPRNMTERCHALIDELDGLAPRKA